MNETLHPWTHASPSQLRDWRRCRRRWYLGKILRVPVPSKPSQEKGKAHHASAEGWLLRGEAPDPVVTAGIDLLPPPPVPAWHVEALFGLWVPPWPVPVVGKIDLLEPDHDRVTDHKTTSKASNAVEADALRTDPQGIVYGLHARAFFDGTSEFIGWHRDRDDRYPVYRLVQPSKPIEFRHVYYLTSGKPKAWPVSAVLSVADLRDGAEAIGRDLATMAIDAVAAHEVHVPPNGEACGDWGGCPFLGRCAQFGLRTLFGPLPQGASDLMENPDLLARLRASNPAPPPVLDLSSEEAQTQYAIRYGHYPAFRYATVADYMASREGARASGYTPAPVPGDGAPPLPVVPALPPPPALVTSPTPGQPNPPDAAPSGNAAAFTKATGRKNPTIPTDLGLPVAFVGREISNFKGDEAKALHDALKGCVVVSDGLLRAYTWHSVGGSSVSALKADAALMLALLDGTVPPMTTAEYTAAIASAKAPPVASPAAVAVPLPTPTAAASIPVPLPAAPAAPPPPMRLPVDVTQLGALAGLNDARIEVLPVGPPRTVTHAIDPSVIACVTAAWDTAKRIVGEGDGPGQRFATGEVFKALWSTVKP